MRRTVSVLTIFGVAVLIGCGGGGGGGSAGRPNNVTTGTISGAVTTGGTAGLTTGTGGSTGLTTSSTTGSTTSSTTGSTTSGTTGTTTGTTTSSTTGSTTGSDAGATTGSTTSGTTGSTTGLTTGTTDGSTTGSTTGGGGTVSLPTPGNYTATAVCSDTRPANFTGSGGGYIFSGGMTFVDYTVSANVNGTPVTETRSFLGYFQTDGTIYGSITVTPFYSVPYTDGTFTVQSNGDVSVRLTWQRTDSGGNVLYNATENLTLRRQ